MKSIARKIPVPTFQERWSAVVEELFDVPPDQQVAALRMLDAALDQALDLLAEERRPKGSIKTDAIGHSCVVGSIPVGFIRTQLNARGGDCNLRSYVAAVQER